jgi:hypothetical protein
VMKNMIQWRIQQGSNWAIATPTKFYCYLFLF